MKRSYQTEDKEPEESKRDIPSEIEHLFQITDFYTKDDDIGKKLNLDDNTVSAQAEVVGGNEEGRTLLIRISLDQEWKGFYYTRLFLKAIGENYKGQFDIDTNNFIGRQFYATVKHKDGYANIDTYNFAKKVEQPVKSNNPDGVIDPKDIAWEE